MHAGGVSTLLEQNMNKAAASVDRPGPKLEQLHGGNRPVRVAQRAAIRKTLGEGTSHGLKKVEKTFTGLLAEPVDEANNPL